MTSETHLKQVFKYIQVYACMFITFITLKQMLMYNFGAWSGNDIGSTQVWDIPGKNC